MLAAVKSEHLDAGFTDPTQPRNVRLAAEGASRIAAEKRGWPRERLPFPVEALLAHVNSVRFLSDVGLRDAALVAVGVRLMLRPGELAKMMIGDIQVRGEDIRVRLGKTKADQKSERRPLPLERVLSSPACPVKLLKAWMLRRRAQGAPDSARLFLGAAGKALTSSDFVHCSQDGGGPRPGPKGLCGSLSEDWRRLGRPGRRALCGSGDGSGWLEIRCREAISGTSFEEAAVCRQEDGFLTSADGLLVDVPVKLF